MRNKLQQYSAIYNQLQLRMKLTTERLVIRDLKIEDKVRLFEIYSDKEAMKYRGSAPFNNLLEVEDMLQKTFQNIELNKEYRYAVDVKEPNELIGTFLIKIIANKVCEVGYSLDKNYWGLGYGGELLQEMLNYLTSIGHETIIATSRKENLASKKLLEKVGFIIVSDKETDALCYFQFNSSLVKKH